LLFLEHDRGAPGLTAANAQLQIGMHKPLGFLSPETTFG
jgi:hypothetical protein